MSQLAYIKRLYTYNDWANRETLVSLQCSRQAPELSVQRMAHILAAEQIWHSRLCAESTAAPVWPDHTMDEIANQIDRMKERWDSYLRSLTEAELVGEIAYSNSRGEAFASRRDDVLHHVIAHGAYHRGQIAGDLRKAGATPAKTDLIFYVR